MSPRFVEGVLRVNASNVDARENFLRALEDLGQCVQNTRECGEDRPTPRFWPLPQLIVNQIHCPLTLLDSSHETASPSSLPRLSYAPPALPSPCPVGSVSGISNTFTREFK
eukprot:CAMPEP_0197483544 /NCGR_PEP_ID=MMETSP1309-20131121/56943_1 /TAXON_ID=464262 /ORGANISM="Genus nov. species nov., Strain RCC998" /LENGTH=110 /DNA_ID=CAMNT_0043026153 /DNA_START=252 /DNA_END=584 /DNA_ORIENTATION=+